jgi:hypothetical protein
MNQSKADGRTPSIWWQSLPAIRLGRIAVGFVLALAAAAGGYWIRGTGSRGSLALPISAPRTEEVFAETSFSEIHNTKALLGELSERFVAETEEQLIVDHRQAGWPLTPTFPRLLQRLDWGRAAFSGTPQEMYLTREFLRLLKFEAQHDRWLQVYLGAVYRHPTQVEIAQLSADAIRAARSCGRENDLIEAYRHVCAIPFDFESKERVREALRALSAGAEFVHHADLHDRS